jgi:hypothetical protein
MKEYMSSTSPVASKPTMVIPNNLYVVGNTRFASINTTIFFIALLIDRYNDFTPSTPQAISSYSK